jgi:hypothetical protein
LRHIARATGGAALHRRKRAAENDCSSTVQQNFPCKSLANRPVIAPAPPACRCYIIIEIAEGAAKMTVVKVILVVTAVECLVAAETVDTAEAVASAETVDTSETMASTETVASTAATKAAVATPTTTTNQDYRVSCCTEELLLRGAETTRLCKRRKRRKKERTSADEIGRDTTGFHDCTP